jgi:cyanophycinase
MTKQILAIGGGDLLNADSIIKKFISQMKNDLVVALTVATEHPKETGIETRQLFRKFGIKNIKIIDVSERSDAFLEKSLETIESAGGLFFTGGDQFHITSLMGGSPMERLVKAKCDKGIITAGTSAGAAMLGESMIISGKSASAPKMYGVEMSSGIGFLKDAIVDTHFSQRGRHGRMITAISYYPQLLAIGIDERTGIFIKDDKFEVFGDGSVTVFDAADSRYNNASKLIEGETVSMFDIKIHVLGKGRKFDLETKRPIII